MFPLVYKRYFATFPIVLRFATRTFVRKKVNSEHTLIPVQGEVHELIRSCFLLSFVLEPKGGTSRKKVTFLGFPLCGRFGLCMCGL